MAKTATSVKHGEQAEPLTRIIRDRKILHGQPVIKGTRIPVSLIFDYLADGRSVQDILQQFPHLTPEDVAEALRYGSAMLHGHVDIKDSVAYVSKIRKKSQCQSDEAFLREIGEWKKK